MKAERKESGWGFWLLWMAASVFGMYIGFMGGFSLGGSLENNTATDVVFGMSLGTDSTKLDPLFIPLNR